MNATRGDLAGFLSTKHPVVQVRVIDVKGSAPRGTDALMFVDPNGIWGTIGGGRLEWQAIHDARSLISSGDNERLLDLPLGPELRQCCGGRVHLHLSRLDPEARAAALEEVAASAASQPTVCVFGAGHVGRALAAALALLPVQTRLIDSRSDQLRHATTQVQHRLTASPEEEVAAAPVGSAFVVTTHEHALDFLITGLALARSDARYVGLIGSKTKRAQLERWLRAGGPAGADLSRLICPIGAAGRGDKRPEVIAAFVAAEVMASLNAA